MDLGSQKTIGLQGAFKYHNLYLSFVPRSIDPFYKVSYCIKRVTTYWTYSTIVNKILKYMSQKFCLVLISDYFISSFGLIQAAIAGQKKLHH